MSEASTIQFFQLFYRTARAVLSAPSMQSTLDSLVENSVKALDVKGGTLRLVNEKSNQLEQVAAYGLSAAYLNKGTLNADQSIPEVLQGETVVITDAYADPRIQYRDALRAEGINTLLSVPVIAAGKVIGVLRLYAEDRHEFSAEILEFAAALAELGGLAIANERLYEAEGSKLATLLEQFGVDLPRGAVAGALPMQGFADLPCAPEKSLEYFRVLHEIIRAILAAVDLEQVTRQIIETTTTLMEVKGAALRLINETTGELELLASRGLSQRFLTKGPPHIDRSIRETLEGKPVLISDTTSDLRLEYPAETAAEGIASILSLPIIARQRVIGVLRIYASRKRAYSQADVTFLAAVAEIAGIAIMDAKLYQATRNDLSFWNATLGYLQEEN
jgi:GAF domain-containing protein